MMDKPVIISELGKIVGEKNIFTDAVHLQKYGTDRTNRFAPDPLAVVFPFSTQQVQQVVQLANRMTFKLVPSGGRTGLSGGAVASQQEVVVSMERMNRILDFNARDRLLCCEAGTITQRVQEFAGQNNLFFPVDLASSGSSQVGGNIATNAGGNRVIRYGMMRSRVRGLTVVTGAGEVLELNRGLKKNNAGYDLMQLFVGSEGTLGIICVAELELVARPQLHTALFAVAGFVAAMELFDALRHLENDAATVLSAVEYFSDVALGYVLDQQGLKPPFAARHPAYVLAEFEGDPDAVARLPGQLHPDRIRDAVMARNMKETSALWCYREGISDSIAKYQPLRNDVAVKTDRLGALVNDLEAISARFPDWELVLFGHLGDGNLHVNFIPPAVNRTLDPTSLEAAICESVVKQDGTLSAEHGIGLTKIKILDYYSGSAGFACSEKIRAVFDPNHILNPGKLNQPEFLSRP